MLLASWVDGHALPPIASQPSAARFGKPCSLLREVGNPDFFRAIGNPDLLPGALEFGFAGLVAGQTARLNFVNRSGVAGTPPDPCRATVAFVDQTGAPLLESKLDLAPQHGTSFELSASRVNANGAVTSITSIRPVIRLSGIRVCAPAPVWPRSKSPIQ
jgi:hypothetical protein